MNFYFRSDERISSLVSTLAMIFMLSLMNAPVLSAQQCALDSNNISWDTVTWVDASTNNSYTWPFMSGFNVDVDFSMTPLIDTVIGVSGAFVSGFPKIDLGPIPEIDIEFAAAAGAGLVPLEIKVKFSPAVRCLSFLITDIDAPAEGGQQWIDSIKILGDTSHIPKLTPQTMTPSYTIDETSGEIVGVSNVTSGADGDVLVQFEGDKVDSVTILYFDALGDMAAISRRIGLFGNFSYSRQSILPMELLSYNVDKDENCHPMIKWETTHEYDIEYYAIEYSYDGINFSNAAIVEPKNTYTGINHYEQIIDRKLNTDNYFRLVKKELDGSEAVLALDAIDGRGCFAFDGINVYPNPTHKNYFYVEIESKDSKSSEIIIYDQTGRVMSRANYSLNAGNNWFKVSSKSFRPGTYFVQFRSEEEVVTRKVHIIN